MKIYIIANFVLKITTLGWSKLFIISIYMIFLSKSHYNDSIINTNWGEIQNFGWLRPNLLYIRGQVSPPPVLVINPSTPTKCEVIGQIAPTKPRFPTIKKIYTPHWISIKSKKCPRLLAKFDIYSIEILLKNCA